MKRPALTEPLAIGDVELANRVLLAPLAGIGNWFVRMQARRFGAGLAVSEMVSSYAVHYRNERTMSELLTIHPDEHPVSIQLFGNDPEVMGEAAAVVAGAGADIIDINMGCPVKKVCKTGAGAALLRDHDLAVEIVGATAERCDRPVTVKLRSGTEPGDRSGFELALRLAAEAPVAAIGFHPRSAAVHHKGSPDYGLARELARSIEVPMIISGGLHDADGARRAYEHSDAAAVMIARGGLGRPWIFSELTGGRGEPPSRDEIVTELLWIVDRAEQHLGRARALGWLRKLHPWYLETLGISGTEVDRFQREPDLDRLREMIAALAGNAELPASPDPRRRLAASL